MAVGLQAVRRHRYHRPLDPCKCKVTRYDPHPPRFHHTTWQVTSACPTHYRRLPLSVRVRILLNEGYRA